jgi:hypothetical protein
MTELSPAAQAVLDAYQMGPLEDGPSAAAVIRAVALYCKRDRLQLFAIAGELENFADLLPVEDDLTPPLP